MKEEQLLGSEQLQDLVHDLTVEIALVEMRICRKTNEKHLNENEFCIYQNALNQQSTA